MDVVLIFVRLLNFVFLLTSANVLGDILWIYEPLTMLYPKCVELIIVRLVLWLLECVVTA